MKDKILLVEDSNSERLVISSLIGDLCDLNCVKTLAEADREVKDTRYDLVLLDVMLPDGEGFDFCRRLRESEKFRDLPVIFITGKTDIENRVLGFSLGADDYITKPIEPQEFIARVRSKLQRRRTTEHAATLTKGFFRVDMAAQKIYTQNSSAPERYLDLTPSEFKLLVHFLRYENKIFTREDLRSQIWGTTHITTHTIDSHISSLRKKMGPFGGHLKSLPRQGYSFSSVNNEPFKG